MSQQTIRPQKDIVGVEFPVGAEWDVCFPDTPAQHKACVTVRRDQDGFSIRAAVYRGANILAQHELMKLPCETCAKAVALGVAGHDVACHEHGVPHPALIFDGTVYLSLSLAGISPADWGTMGENSRNILRQIGQSLLSGQTDWQSVLNAWAWVEGNDNMTYKIYCWHMLVSGVFQRCET